MIMAILCGRVCSGQMTGHWAFTVSRGYSHYISSIDKQMTGTHSPGIQPYPHSGLKSPQCCLAPLLAPSTGLKYQLKFHRFCISISTIGIKFR